MLILIEDTENDTQSVILVAFEISVCISKTCVKSI